MAKTTYTLFICDQWKSRDSYRFIGNATSLRQVRKAVSALLKNGIIVNHTGVEPKYMEWSDFENLDYFDLVAVETNVIEVTGSYYV